MEIGSTNISATSNGYITRQDIVNFPFPYKLWLSVHLESCDFLRWNRDGTVLLLDLAALDEYLSSTRSIFKIKNRSVFLQHLEEFKFERLNATPEAEEDILLQYKNEDFQRHRLDLLARIRRHTYEVLGNTNNSTDASKSGVEEEQHKSCKKSVKFPPAPALAQETAINALAAERMMGDLCFMFHGSMSNIQTSRLRFQTVLHFQNESRLLMEKLRASDENAARVRRAKAELGVGRPSMGLDDDQVIEIPAELFENPHDSVLNLGEDFRPEYAGYYGNCSKETISNFFGEYLPMYEDGTMEIRKIITDNSTSSNNNEIITAPGMMNTPSTLYSVNIDPASMEPSPSTTTTTFTPQHQQSVTNINFFSGLEPIFKTEDEENVVDSGNSIVIQQTDPNSIDIEAEISMEEFIKFKDPLAVNSTGLVTTTTDVDQQRDNVQEVLVENTNEACNNSLEPGETERFPQMPAAVKMELEEDPVENEANFRNFFSQYRASLNLLYDRH